MADCYYHGQSFSGPCWSCERNRAAGRKDGDDGDFPASTAASEQHPVGINGPLTDAQRDECRTLYNNLKHLQSGGYYVADDVIRTAAGYGYMNGYRDFAEPVASEQQAGADELPSLPAQHDELRAHWKCEDCNGTGEIGELMDQGYFQPPERARCSTCDGAGQVPIIAYTDDQMHDYARVALTRRATTAIPGHAGVISGGEYDRTTGTMYVTVKLPKDGLPVELLTIGSTVSLAATPDTATTEADQQGATQAGDVDMFSTKVGQHLARLLPSDIFAKVPRMLRDVYREMGISLPAVFDKEITAPTGDALAPIIRAVEVNDSDTMARNRPDSDVIWTAEGHWENASITMGDLRRIARDIYAGQ